MDQAKSDAVTLEEVRKWLGVEPGKPVLTAVIAASRAVISLGQFQDDLVRVLGTEMSRAQIVFEFIALKGRIDELEKDKETMRKRASQFEGYFAAAKEIIKELEAADRKVKEDWARSDKQAITDYKNAMHRIAKLQNDLEELEARICQSGEGE